MTPEVSQLLTFYKKPVGAALAELLAKKIIDLWPDLHKAPLLGLGYISPLMVPPPGKFRHILAMPGAQGVAVPGPEAPLSLLVNEEQLPFTDGAFDRIIVVHWLEFTADIEAALSEIRRILTPGGRALFLVTNRLGFWSWREGSPFARGTPFTRRQLIKVLNRNRLHPTKIQEGLHIPPFDFLYRGRQKGVLENLFRLLPGGLLMVEVEKMVLAKRKPIALKDRYKRRLAVPRPAGANLSSKRQ